MAKRKLDEFPALGIGWCYAPKTAAKNLNCDVAGCEEAPGFEVYFVPDPNFYWYYMCLTHKDYFAEKVPLREMSLSEAAQRLRDAERKPLTPKEKEVYLRTRRNNSDLTAEDLGSTEEVLDAIEEKGWVQGDFDVYARVRRYWRLPNWKDDTGKGNGYDPLN